MSITLYLGDYAYSSWSLRGWLMLDAFGVTRASKTIRMYDEAIDTYQAEIAPFRTLPGIQFAEGEPVLCESIMIAEEIASRFPDAGVWPTDPGQRAIARTLSAEMHSGFAGLRGLCPMNLRRRYSGFELTEAAQKDVERIETLWAWAIEHSGEPYLCGAFSAADAMFAPVATRIVSFGIPVSDASMDYIEAIYAHPSFRRWHAMADADERVIERYDVDLPSGDIYATPRFQGPTTKVLEAKSAQSINDTCPFSGKPVDGTWLVDVDGQVIATCNPFCRDKTAADPTCWPGVAKLLGR